MGKKKSSKQETHRVGPLKQSNKKHKTGRHRSKGAIDAEVGGKISSVTSISKKHRGNVSRAERRKQSSAIRNKKIQDMLEYKRQIGGLRGAPICVSIIPLSSCSNPKLVMNHILDKLKDDVKLLGKPSECTAYLRMSNGKNVTIVVPPSKDIWAILDTMKTTDITLFHVPTLDTLADEDLTLLRAAREQGLVTPQVFTTSAFSKTEEKAFLKGLSKLFVSVPKVHQMQTRQQILNAMRVMTASKITVPKRWSQRTAVLIEESDVLKLSSTDVSALLPDVDSQLTQNLFRVVGTVRKQNLNPKRLVHISGLGDFRILRVDITPVEDLVQPDTMQDAIPTMPPRYLYSPDEAEEMDPEDEPGSHECSSDEEAMMSDDEATDEAIESLFDRKEPSIDTSEGNGVRSTKASGGHKDWLGDSDSGSDSDNSESMDEMECESVAQNDEVEDDEEDWEDEQEQLRLARAARTEAEFPDWIDTPMDRLARDRFQRYRGLQSFRKSEWDPYENLPREYAKIFQFADFRRSLKSAITEPQDGPGFIPVGQRISVILTPESSSVSLNAVNAVKPVSMFSHLRHEGKMSVLNLLLNVTDAIKNKEELVFQVGHRRFQSSTILSECTPGNKHKMLRFAQPNTSCVATVIAPIVFPTASVIVFRISKSSLIPIGGGSILSIDPARVVVKRILLSGAPFRPHGRKAVVRFMFFNREDIEWFKPVELRTRYGRRGHITEPLGTHGRMKCTFDGVIKSQDTILMPLYKRVFPKCTYDPVVAPFSIYGNVSIRSSVLGQI